VIGIRLDADKEFVVFGTTLLFKRGKVRRVVTASDATTLETVDSVSICCIGDVRRTSRKAVR